MEDMGNVNASKNQFWSRRPVLVTGGAGFIGSWLSHDLLCLGARVVILDIKEQLPFLGGSMDDVLGKAVFVKGDVRDSKILSSLYSRYRIQTVFHLAAKAVVQEAEEDPALALETNVGGTWQVLEAFRNRKGRKGQVIVASSDKAYGEHATLPYREDFALLGEHPYDCSKACADRIANMYAKVYDIPLCIIRCGNVYGGGDLHFSRLIPGAIRSFFFDKPFEIRSDGFPQRDYVYIKDIVRAYVLAAQAFADHDMRGEVFNVGTAKPLRALDVARHVASVMGKSHIKPVILGKARHEIRDQYLDAAKAKKILGWEPRYSFQEGIKETVRWYNDFFKS